MTGVVLRRARAGDAEAIARIHVETWRATYAGLLPDRYLVGMSAQGQSFTWQKAIARCGRNEAILVAQDEQGSGGDGGPIVGFGNAGPARSNLAPYKAEVYTLYVALDWQGRGIGRQLLGGLFRGLVEAGLGDAYLWVLSSNPSRFFYEAMGGERAAERQEAFAGALLDETAYGWPNLEAWLGTRESS